MSCSVIVIRQVLITDWKTLRYNLQYKVNDSLVLTYRSKEEACLSGIKEKKGSASFKFFSNLNKKVSHFFTSIFIRYRLYSDTFLSSLYT